MKVAQLESIKAAPVEMEGALGCHMRALIGEPDGAPSFSMRQFDVAPGGHTPHHSHAYEHEVFVLEGQGVVLEGDREHAIGPGSVVYVPPGQEHQFRNTGAHGLRFLCLIPHPLRAMNGPCTAACDCG